MDRQLQVLERVEEHGIVVVVIPAGMTDRLQPLDVSTNKAAKDFLREKFRRWYASEVEKQIQAGKEEASVDMGMAVMEEVGARWLTALYDKLCSERIIIINGFKNVGIIDAIHKARESPLLVSDILPPTDSIAQHPFADIED